MLFLLVSVVPTFTGNWILQTLPTMTQAPRSKSVTKRCERRIKIHACFFCILLLRTPFRLSKPLQTLQRDITTTYPKRQWSLSAWWLHDLQFSYISIQICHLEWFTWCRWSFFMGSQEGFECLSRLQRRCCCNQAVHLVYPLWNKMSWVQIWQQMHFQ